MKFFTLLFITIFIANSAMAQDTIPNPGFENWSQGGGYTYPDIWNSPNPLTNVIGVIPARQDSLIVHSGKFSCNLVTLYVSAISSNVPGIVTTGVIPTAQGQTISGGAIIHSRPKAVNGWFRYTPAGHDTAGVMISLIKGDSIIGSGYVNFPDTVSTWTFFSFNINYTSNSIPDTSQLSIQSSIGNGVAHSSLWVDDLSYSYFTTGVEPVKASEFRVYPNPASTAFVVDNETVGAKALSMYAVDGKLIKGFSLHAGLNNLDVSTLPAGVYILKGIGTDGSEFHSSVVIDK